MGGTCSWGAPLTLADINYPKNFLSKLSPPTTQLSPSPSYRSQRRAWHHGTFFD